MHKNTRLLCFVMNSSSLVVENDLLDCRLFDSSVTFHCLCHHYEASACLGLRPKTHGFLIHTRLRASYTRRHPSSTSGAGTTWQTCQRLLVLMFTHQVLIQTLPPATAAGDTSGPITAAAQVLRNTESTYPRTRS